MKYVEPVNSPAYPERNGSYVTANPTTGLRGSWVPGESLEHPMREIVHVIEMAGLTPSSADLTQLYQAILLLSPEITGFLPLAGGTMEGSILAKTDNTISLGTAIKRLKEIFAVRFRGIADSSDKLQTARTINGVGFDGTANITIFDATKAMLPKSATGIGQWINIQATNNQYVLPSGGTWAYWVIGVRASYGDIGSCEAGIVAGGTIITQDNHRPFGFAWRIA